MHRKAASALRRADLTSPNASLANRQHPVPYSAMSLVQGTVDSTAHTSPRSPRVRVMPGKLADNTVLVHLYVDERHKAAWRDAAPRHGYTSMSKYLYDLILKARSYRDQGFLTHHDSENRIADLKVQIQGLEDQLDQERVKQSGRISIDDSAFIQQFLTNQYQPLAQIMQRVLKAVRWTSWCGSASRTSCIPWRRRTVSRTSPATAGNWSTGQRHRWGTSSTRPSSRTSTMPSTTSCNGNRRWAGPTAH